MLAAQCHVSSSKSTYAACPLTWRQSSWWLPHAGRPEAQTLLLEPGSPLLLQLLLDLVDLLC